MNYVVKLSTQATEQYTVHIKSLPCSIAEIVSCLAVKKWHAPKSLIDLALETKPQSVKYRGSVSCLLFHAELKYQIFIIV